MGQKSKELIENAEKAMRGMSLFTQRAEESLRDALRWDAQSREAKLRLSALSSAVQQNGPGAASLNGKFKEAIAELGEANRHLLPAVLKLKDELALFDKDVALSRRLYQQLEALIAAKKAKRAANPGREVAKSLDDLIAAMRKIGEATNEANNSAVEARARLGRELELLERMVRDQGAMVAGPPPAYDL